ncbi:MAG: hypothetical protein JKY45_07380 [Emcibacter sp.]|nr:hypothetical protein [Emcibacter sp.]
MPPMAILLYGRIIYAAFNALLWTYAMVTPGMAGILLWTIAAIQASYIIHAARLACVSRLEN